MHINNGCVCSHTTKRVKLRNPRCSASLPPATKHSSDWKCLSYSITKHRRQDLNSQTELLDLADFNHSKPKSVEYSLLIFTMHIRSLSKSSLMSPKASKHEQNLFDRTMILKMLSMFLLSHKITHTNIGTAYQFVPVALKPRHLTDSCRSG